MIPDHDGTAAIVAAGTDYIDSFDLGDEVEESYRGHFRLCIPTAKDWVKIGIIQHRLREGVPLEELDSVAGSVVVMLSTLAVIVIEAPAYWYKTEGKTQVAAIEDIRNMDVLWAIYGRYAAFRRTFSYGEDDSGSGENSEKSDTVASQSNPESQPV